VDPERGQGTSFSSDPDWEQSQIARVAARYPLRFTEDLKAELAITVLKLKQRQSPGINDWKAYIAKALSNRAMSLARKWRAQEHREIGTAIDPETIPPLRAPDDQSAKQHSVARRQLAQVRRLLDAESYAFLEALANADNNQSLLARRLVKHRNKVGRRGARIKRQLFRCPIENVTDAEQDQLAQRATASNIKVRDRFKAPGPDRRRDVRRDRPGVPHVAADHFALETSIPKGWDRGAQGPAPRQQAPRRGQNADRQLAAETKAKRHSPWISVVPSHRSRPRPQ
jgi:hypothetical protein